MKRETEDRSQESGASNRQARLKVFKENSEKLQELQKKIRILPWALISGTAVFSRDIAKMTGKNL